jgi:hypothetical protein
MSEIQSKYISWYNSEKEKGLKSIHFVTGNIEIATIDSFIEESNAIDEAIKDGKHYPFPDVM